MKSLLLQKQPQINLALGSGGWRGLAHIGVIKSLVKHHFTIGAIAGASAGSLIGGMYALWLDVERIEWTFNKLKYKDLLSIFSATSTKLGLFKNSKTIAVFEKYIGKATFDDLQIPFVAMGTDIITGQSVTLNKGNLATAMQASSSIPLIFVPPVINNKIIIDGGAACPVPVHEVHKLAPANKIVAVNLYQSIFPVQKPREKLTKIDVAMLSYQLVLNKLSKVDAAAADVLIEPALAHAQSDPFSRFINNQQAIDSGEAAMDAQIKTILSL